MYTFVKALCLTMKQHFKIPMTSMFVLIGQDVQDLIKNTSANNESGRFSIIFWGCLSYYGLGICWRIEERFNAQTYHPLLEYVMLLSVRQVYHSSNFMHQEDNCPLRTASTIRKWFVNNNIEILTHPAKRPDLNSMENVKKIFKNKCKVSCRRALEHC